MLEINIRENSSFKTVELKGRIDGLSSYDIEKELTRLTSEGERLLVINLASVNYVSSAGLRILLSAQKMLKKIGGEIVLSSIQPQVFSVFQISGFDSIFRIINEESELIKDADAYLSGTVVINGIKIQHKKVTSGKGEMFLIGSPDKLQKDLYAEKDIIEVNASGIEFGTGAAALGDEYEEYKFLFGESLIIAGNMFSYPAIKKSAVDFMLKEQMNKSLSLKYLYGFGINGGYSAIFNFADPNNYLSLTDVVNTAKELSVTNLFGVVLLGESGGIYGMNLKQSPVTENKPSSGGIFDAGNFADWIDFPLEPSYTNNIIAAAGIAVKDKNLLREERRIIISEDSDFHIHGVIFEKEFINKDIDCFNSELNRVVKEMKAYKVQHLLGKSKFKSGMAAIIELEEC